MASFIYCPDEACHVGITMPQLVAKMRKRSSEHVGLVEPRGYFVTDEHGLNASFSLAMDKEPCFDKSCLKKLVMLRGQNKIGPAGHVKKGVKRIRLDNSLEKTNHSLVMFVIYLIPGSLSRMLGSNRYLGGYADAAFSNLKVLVVCSASSDIFQKLISNLVALSQTLATQKTTLEQLLALICSLVKEAFDQLRLQRQASAPNSQYPLVFIDIGYFPEPASFEYNGLVHAMTGNEISHNGFWFTSRALEGPSQNPRQRDFPIIF
ncbi:hypothetical protein DSO57_1034141 [Entomophthora muscae]|uniref:Uncharacterized protein n=1 Tax=Entomophthora muscae TaxID=34485 RepID=A0ACC2TYL6_9FUNG|nr:hypothetical protein DSO57_1034141 [Entomophthora muscae]